MRANTNRWSDEETATLVRMRSEGATDPQIAEAVGRTIKSVECRWRYLSLSEEGREIRRQGMRERRISSGIQNRRPDREDRLERLYRPTPEMIRERDMRLSMPPRDLTAAFFGDPPPGYSALDRREAVKTADRIAYEIERQRDLGGGKPRLSPDLVREIRNSKEMHVEVAARLGLHRKTVEDVRHGRTWRHVS